MRTTRDVRVGELLIEEGLISEEQLGAVLAEQLATRAYVPLGQILVEKGLVTRKQLTIILDRHHKRPRLGQLLVRNVAMLFDPYLLKRPADQPKIFSRTL